MCHTRACLQGSGAAPANLPAAQRRLLLPWLRGQPLAAWLHEQRVAALMLELAAHELIGCAAAALGGEVRMAMDALDASLRGPSASGEERLGCGDDGGGAWGRGPEPNPLNEVLVQALASCSQTAWLHVAVRFVEAAAELRQEGQLVRMDAGPRVAARPWRQPPVMAAGLWSGMLSESPLALAASMLALRRALNEVRAQAAHLAWMHARMGALVRGRLRMR